MDDFPALTSLCFFRSAAKLFVFEIYISGFCLLMATQCFSQTLSVVYLYNCVIVDVWRQESFSVIVS